MERIREDASRLRAIVIDFFHVGGNRRNPALENFPGSEQEPIPWRRVYKLSDTQTLAYPDMQLWELGDLSFGGAGSLWCLTVLVRNCENISRRTDDGNTWSSKTGRVPKKGYPAEIVVDKLVLSDKSCHMLELTLAEQEKPIVALCKIWRNTGAVASPQTTVSSVGTGGMEMEIDQAQEVNPEVVSQQHVPAYEVTVIHEHFAVPNPTEGESETMHEVSSESTGQDIDTTFEKAVSNLYKMKCVFAYLAIVNEDAGKKIASAVQYAASTMSNILNIKVDDDAPSAQPSSSNYAHNDEFLSGSYIVVEDE